MNKTMKVLAAMGLSLLAIAFVAPLAQSSNQLLYVDSTARTSSVVTETLVLAALPDGGTSTGTPVPASPLSGRKAMEVCNNGANTITCTASGATVVANKARKLLAGDCWSLDCDGTACPVRCLASTADQTTANATVSTEVK